ncbi:neuraminidase-like domain-containing protein [Massilia sp. CCM 9210]|uniref:Tc toxin subunit A-related protein n=1 Tax=Massilia scottii TaxID=3057166 RepID=UPI002796C9B4|nr:neuraminidase-like domain-containing protein [Massilia sp. CCM 9210]MDQ1812281.1 neuraminidase-like domain-containing protein [Massilia sp. CCM 9210]
MNESIAYVTSIGVADAGQVARLQQALRALRFPIADAEMSAGVAGPSTVAAIRAVERGAKLRIDTRMVLGAAAAGEINRRLEAAGVALDTDGKAADLLYVEGTVRGSDGVPVAAIEVRVYDQDLRVRQMLGSVHTDHEGNYLIPYDGAAFARAEKGYADIVVQVGEPKAETPLYESAILFNAPAHLVHDVRLATRGPSLFRRLMAALAPLAEQQEVRIEEIDENARFRDISFLAGETGFAPSEIAALAVAARLARDTKFEHHMLFALVLGGLWSEPATGEHAAHGELDARAKALRERFGEVSRRQVAGALDNAAERAIIAASKDEIARFTDAFADFSSRDEQARQRLGIPLAALNRVLGEQAGAVRQHLDSAADSAEFLRRLQADVEVAPELVRRVEGVVALGTASLGDTDLTLQLAEQLRSADDVRMLARLDAGAWHELLLKHNPDRTPPAFIAAAGGDLARYGALLEARFAQLYPTQAFAGAAARDPKAGRATAQLETLLREQPDIEFADLSLDRYFARRGEGKGREAAAALKPLQRLYKVSPDYPAVAVMARHGLHSAQAVYRRGEDAIVALLRDEAGMSARAARLAYARAATTAAASLQVAVGLAAEVQVGAPMVMGALEDNASFPELAPLFALGNDCACEDCRSVLSPAAYLADLLLFLFNRQLGTGRNAKDVLLARRPDLAWIDLDCANAHTPLPYVDLAIEAMEELVAPDRVGTLGAALRATLPTDSADHAPDAAVVAAFAGFAEPVALSAAARVRQVGASWIVRDGQRHFRVPDGAGPLAVLVLRNTHGSARERELMPEYANASAQTALAGISYPWTLPLDLEGAETAQALSKLGIERHRLMRTLRGPALPNNPADFDIAAARLGISPALASILVTPAADPSAQWGAANVAQAVARMEHVPAFLDLTGLSYADLLRLLALPYANSGGALAIAHLDDSCDLAQKRLTGLDAAALDRLHRFLRLTRALALPAADADLLVRRFGAGGALGVPQDLVAIAQVMEVRSALGDLAPEEAAALFGPIPAQDRFEQPHQMPLPSLYARLFLDPLVQRPLDPAFALDAVSAPAPAALLADHRAALGAALQLGDADVHLLLPLAGPALSLDNLSLLFRHARVARALSIGVAEWSVFARLAAGDPFASPAALLAMLDLVARSRALGLDGPLLAHLLEARLDVDGALAADAIGEALGALRDQLRTVDADTAAPSADADRATLLARLRDALAVLDPDPARAALIGAIVEQRLVARAEIAPVPAGAYTPSSAVLALPLTVVNDGARMVLSFTGILSPAAKTLLSGVAGAGPVAADPLWLAALDALEAQWRLPLATVSTRYEAALAALPAGLSLPPEFKRRARHVARRRVFQFDGVMSAAERDALLALSPDPAWAAALAALYAQPRATPVAAAERLADFATWQFAAAGDDEAAADVKVRANLQALLAVLLPRARRAASEETITAALQVITGLERDAMLVLLQRINLGARSLMAVLGDRAAFVDLAGPLTPAALPAQFQGVDLLHRSARIATLFLMGARELDLAITLASAGSDLLAFQALPLAYTGAAPLAPPLARLVGLGEILLLDRKSARKPLRLLDLMARILAAPGTVSPGGGGATLDLYAAANTALGWNTADVALLAQPGAGLGLAYPADFFAASGWLRLQRALAQVLKTGLGVADALRLGRAVPGKDEAALARMAMRARLGEQFAVALRQVQDRLRTLRRDALHDYLLAHVQPGSGALPPSPTGRWRRPTDVFAYLLIDPKMGACQMTSRIVQATIAVQTFVERCRLGFEPEVSPTMAGDARWDQWDWMKAYRLWEANRKVFLFPENWVEPELRRDKSYAFKELQDELLQTELTEDSAREAFLNYIDKLDQVANLDVTGVHWEDGGGSGRGALHVVGRTAGQEPHAWFYRRFEHPAERWSAWSKIDLDLKSAPVVPFMYDRRIFLAWPEFREQKPATGDTITIPGAGGGGAAEVKNPGLSTGVALSELRNGKWSPKKVAAQFLPTATVVSTWVLPLQARLAWTPLDLRKLDGGNFYFHDPDARYYSGRGEYYEFLGCRGYPEPTRGSVTVANVTFVNMHLQAARDVEMETNSSLVAVGGSTYGAGTLILGETPSWKRITYPHHINNFDLNFLQSMRLLAILMGQSVASTHGNDRRQFALTGTRAPWILADKRRSFFVEPVSAPPDGRLLTGSALLDWSTTVVRSVGSALQPLVQLIIDFILLLDPNRRLRMSPFYHPMVCALRERLLEGGVARLMARPTQFLRGDLDFAASYNPNDAVVLRDDQHGNAVYHPREEVDFSARGAYSLYNWELFYHAPFMVGTELMRAGRHEDAMRWLRHIFDPAGADGKDPVSGVPLAAGDKRRFWITKPFFEREAPGYAAGRIDSILRLLAAQPGDPGVDMAARDELIRQVATWRDHPFDPHLIASSRNIAYQKAAFLRFVENLVAWGDKLFAASDVESVMAGGALYLYAKSFIGELPEEVAPRVKPVARTYAEIELDIDAFGNAMVAVEDLLPALPPMGPPESGAAPPSVLHFCIPRNDKLLSMWRLVDDRVHKYQACLDLLGQPRKTSLFAPPIDPAAAIAAMMAGVSAGDLLADSAAPLPPYRFATYLQKANELAADLKAAAGSLLSALEKKDGEALALLRQSHELKLLDATRAIKLAAIAEAESAVANLEVALAMARLRNQFYVTRTFMNAGESTAQTMSAASLVISVGAVVADTLGGVMAAIPNFSAGASGFGGSPHVAVQTGGMAFSRALEMAAKALTQTAGIIDKGAGMVSTVAGYQRRFEDWQMQASVTAREIEQVGIQIAGAGIRVANARRELANHEQQVDNAKAVDQFMRSKYTGQELYSWQAAEIGKTFFETYKLAYAHAKLAERCYRFDHGLATSSIIGFGAWDSARKGLQSGERLQLDLRRLDSAYLAANRRSFELTKNVSVALAAPLELIGLRRNGRCEIELPEELFDLDYPGHYFRRIKSVAISIPCVTGANTTLACTLRLLRNSVRTSVELPGGAAGYARRMQDGMALDDGRFRDEQVPVSAIATSTGQNDAGLFEPALRDERILPFEGAGAVSRWSIELMDDETLRGFDYDSIADVILHIRYTAREEAGAFRAAAMANLRAQLVAAQSRLELRRVFRVSADFASAWTALRNPAPGSAPELRVELRRERIIGGDERLIRLRNVQLLAEYPRRPAGSEPDVEWEVGAPPLAAAAISALAVDPDDTRYATSTVSAFAPAVLGAGGVQWRFRFRDNGADFETFDPATFTELYLVVGYTVQAQP